MEEGRKQNLPDQMITSMYRKARYELTHHKEGLIGYLEKICKKKSL